MGKNRGNFKVVLFMTLILSLFIFLIKADAVEQAIAADQTDVEVQVQAVVEITHQEVLALTNEFMEILVQDINDETYKVLNYNTKAELLVAFEAVTSQSIAKPYVDFYYEEEEDGLYIIPTSTPPWFESENDYSVVQLDQNTVKVSQFNETEFYGDYEIELELTFSDKWTITAIVYP